MRVWTEVKCYACSRVCGEVLGVIDPPGRLLRRRRLRLGLYCTLLSHPARCSRCGSRVYTGERYTEPTYGQRRQVPVSV